MDNKYLFLFNVEGLKKRDVPLQHIQSYYIVYNLCKHF